MSCLYSNCQEKVELICKSCENNPFLCKNHAWDHKSIENHDFESINQETSQKLLIRFLKKEIKRCILRISNDTQEIISSVKIASSNAIKKLKTMNKNIRNISEFKKVQFDTEKVTFLVSEAKLLAQEIPPQYSQSNFNYIPERNVQSRTKSQNLALYSPADIESFSQPKDYKDKIRNSDNWNCLNCSRINEKNNNVCAYCRSNPVNVSPNQKRLFQITSINEESVGNWECICGTLNISEYKICKGCKNLRSGEKGWVCVYCTFLNEESTKFCLACQNSPIKSLQKNAKNDRIKQEIRKCTVCQKQIATVLCHCNNPVRISSSKCVFCSSDITNIKECSDCSPRVRKSTKTRLSDLQYHYS